MDKKGRYPSRTEIIIALLIFLFSIEPLLQVRVITGPLFFMNRVYYYIHDRYFLSKEEIIKRNVYKITNNMPLLKSYVNRYITENNCIVNSIDDIKISIKYCIDHSFPVYERERKGIEYNRIVKELLFDPYGDELYYNPDNYEILCNNPDIIAFLEGKNERENCVINVMNLRVCQDMQIIFKGIQKFYKENNEFPSKINELNIDLPCEKWGMSYEVDNQNYEIVCKNNKVFKFNYKFAF